MNESTQKILEMQSKECIAMSNKLIIAQNELAKALVELEDMRKKYEPLRKTFEELIEESLEYREKLHYRDEENWMYDKYEKANLL